MFYTLSKILDLLFAPLTWAMAAVVCAAFWLRGSRRVGRARVALAVAVAVLLVFSVDATANRLVRSLEVSAVSQRHEGVHYDAVVLLGGMLEDRVTASGSMPAFNERAERLTVTYELLHDNVAGSVIISGTSDVPEAIEADVLARELEHFGIAPARILREGKSRNTRENALFTRDLVREHGFHSLLLVTSAFHMARAQGCFNAVGLATDAYPVDFASYDSERFASAWLPRASALNMSTWALREWFGRIVYHARGYTAPTLLSETHAEGSAK